MTPSRLTELSDDLGRQSDPPRAVRHRLDAVQSPRPAPGGYRGYVHIQEIRRHAGRTPPVPTVPVRTRGRAVRTTARDRMGISDPLDLGCGEGAPGPGAKSLLIQQGRDLPIGLSRGEFPHPSD